MIVEDFRAAADRLWETVNEEADRLKDSYVALDRLYAWYRQLDTLERPVADEVVAGWVMSDTEAKRFDAVALIREFEVVRAVPALRELARRLGKSGDPGAPFEREKVESLAAELGSPGPDSGHP